MMLKILLIAIPILATSAEVEKKTKYKTLFIPDGPSDPWGDSSNSFQISDGYFACGARVQREPNQGIGDDTAMNGLSLYFCRLGNWDEQSMKGFDGPWGIWGPIKMCPKGYFVTAVKGQFEEAHIGDNTALNGIAFKCKSPSDPSNYK